MSTMSSKADARPWWKLNRREQSIALICLSAVLIGAWLPGRIVVSTSPSLTHRIFFKVGFTPDRIQDGDYLAFKIDEKEVQHIRKGKNEKNDIALKRVGCIPGQQLISDTQGLFVCDGQMLGFALDKDSKGEKLPTFRYSGPVPADSYFMVGTNPHSFDSRYIGFLHDKDFLFKALPLW